MSHFSLNLPSSDTLWYTPSPMDPHSHSHHQKPLPLFYQHPSFKYDDVPPDQCDTTTTTTTTTTTSSSSTIDHEYMFEKPLTPSDVGKLNRLVIPKQHAEKYFPLSTTTTNTTSAAADGSTPGGGGVLLGFEDESGKCWKFRYSYWNSSQSYVLTKGWSRYVKEKKLDAGDVVLFQRHRFENDRFFIGWRRRGSNPVQSHNTNHTVPLQNYGAHAHAFNSAPHPHQIASFSPYRRDSLHATGTEVRQKGRKSMGRKVRLFGVNLDCRIEEEEEEEEEEQVVGLEEDEEIMSQTSDGSSLSSQGQGQGQHTPSFSVGPHAYNYFDYVGYSPNNNTPYNNNHMDMNFPQDVNQMRNRLR